jgi:hypothetical protein
MVYLEVRSDSIRSAAKVADILPIYFIDDGGLEGNEDWLPTWETEVIS